MTFRLVNRRRSLRLSAARLVLCGDISCYTGLTQPLAIATITMPESSEMWTVSSTRVVVSEVTQYLPQLVLVGKVYPAI